MLLLKQSYTYWIVVGVSHIQARLQVYKGLCHNTSPAILAVSSPPPPSLVVSCLTNSRPTSYKTQLHDLDSHCFTLLTCIICRSLSPSAAAKDAQMQQPKRGTIAMQSTAEGK